MFWNKKNSILKERIKELEEENAKLKNIHSMSSDMEVDKEYNLKFLTQTANDLINSPFDDSIYNYIAEIIRKILPKSVVAINQIDDKKRTSTTKAFVGLQSFVEKTIQILGKHPNDIVYEMDNDFAIQELKTGKLVKVDGGLHELTFGQMPKLICYAIEKTLGIGNIYAIGFVYSGVLYGNAIMILTDNSDVKDVILLESFIYQASLILQKKHAEEKVRESERKYRLLIDNINDVVFTIDTKGNLTSLNKSFETITGLKTSDWISRHFIEIIHPEEKEKALEELHLLITNKPLARSEHKILNFEGKYIDAEFSITPIFKDNKIVELLGSGRDVSERKKTEKFLTDSLKEKTILLQEIHHRVKNNLQIISSLLNLQSNYYVDKPETKNLFIEIQNRISSMSIVHEQLYQTEKLNIISIEKYIKRLVSSISNSYIFLNKKIDFVYDISVETIGIDTIIPFGLILNELYTNSMKYAFKDKQEYCVITIKLYKDDQGYLTLNYHDNGVGLPENVDMNNPKSLGLRLINVFTMQLEGSVSYRNDNGASFLLKFK
ncbi:MAG: hypothetical protein A2X12_09335 [Bacteroidetes bacterium GWE2_29_8]|nr:MAG: hypothetical protein A2X12_09335 [Bacteroidetes bacterium GWE2_29_8]OFY16195.1 MAG: hypothetical protein A2X02_04250 [Bacteroidetes bacterium GWF2_29_10]